MNEFDPTQYSVIIRKKTVDDQTYYVGTVLELPDVEVFEGTDSDAYKEIINIISALKEAADKRGRQFPLPSPVEEEYSGRITLRISKSIHKKAATLAQSEGVSLNQFIVSCVTEAVGQKSVERCSIFEQMLKLRHETEKAVKAAYQVSVGDFDFLSAGMPSHAIALPHAIAAPYAAINEAFAKIYSSTVGAAQPELQTAKEISVKKPLSITMTMQ